MTASRTGLTLALAATILCSGAIHASAGPATCDGALARLTSDKGQSFTVDRYGISRHKERTGRGPLTYVVHVWRGTLADGTRFLHFTEIPGTSGPNWNSARKPSEYRGKIDWTTSATFPLPHEFTVYAGPLKGGWTTACDTAAL